MKSQSLPHINQKPKPCYCKEKPYDIVGFSVWSWAPTGFVVIFANKHHHWKLLFFGYRFIGWPSIIKAFFQIAKILLWLF
jgi:hypothetical protein